MTQGFMRVSPATQWVRPKDSQSRAGRSEIAVAATLGTLLLFDWLVFVVILCGLIGGWFDA